MNSVQSESTAAQTILIVDDNPVNIGVVVDHLEQHGFEVTVALGGEEALKRAAFVKPDLILLDVMMPEIDGFETCRRLKGNPDTAPIPVIFMTALGEVRDKVAGFDAGGVDYISKPFQIEELLARVRTHLELRAAQHRLAVQNKALQEEMSAREEAETALRSSEERFRRLFETANDGILLVDCETEVVTDANPAILTMLHQEQTKLLGQKLSDLESFKDIPGCRTAVAEVREAGHLKFGEWTLRKPDGSQLPVEVIGTVYEADGDQILQCNLRDITERKEAEARIRYLALHDALTGLPNRTMLSDRISVAIAHARRSHKKVGVLMLDLDHFKHINDSLGHHIGDELLEAVAGRLRSCLRESDTAARLGGDEFVIALSEIAGSEDAELVARKVLSTLAEPFAIEGRSLHIGASVGISFYPGDGEDAGALLQAADTAMYHAKENGRGTYRLFTCELNAAAQRWHTLSNDVHRACTRGEFVLHYQPQISVETGAITGVETLLRWNHPTEGLVSPALFIPLLEERGLIVDVGKWVLNSACKQAAKWQADGLPPVRIAVNLSAHQFYRGNIVETVSKALEDSGLAPEWLELELTESLTLDDTETTLRLMHDLKGLGVSLSLDDFGTGWSSLSYLRRFPLDRIKIDRSFVRDLTTHSSTAAIVHSILNLARSLGLDCIAEGVETNDQLDHLQRELCAEIQGFLFSEPLPSGEMRKLLHSAEKLGTIATPEKAAAIASLKDLVPGKVTPLRRTA